MAAGPWSPGVRDSLHGVSEIYAADVRELARQCPLIVHGHTVRSVSEDPTFTAVTRDLQFLDLWGGRGAATAAAQRQGLSAEVFDVEADSAQDFLTKEGFEYAVWQAMRLEPGGACGMAPTCSSFVFGPTSSAKRSAANNFEGDTTQDFVRSGNLQARVAAFFFCLAYVRGFFAWFEQPVSSTMFSYLSLPMASLMKFSYYVITPRCAFDDVPVGQRFQKKYKFVATYRGISAIRRDCPCGDAGHVPLMAEKKTPEGRIQRNGIPDLMKISQVYPASLGAALIDAWWQGGQRPEEFRCPDVQLRATTLSNVGFWAGQRSGASATQDSDEGPWGRSEGRGGPTKRLCKSASSTSGPISLESRTVKAKARSTGGFAPGTPLQCDGGPWDAPPRASPPGDQAGPWSS